LILPFGFWQQARDSTIDGRFFVALQVLLSMRTRVWLAGHSVALQIPACCADARGAAVATNNIANAATTSFVVILILHILPCARARSGLASRAARATGPTLAATRLSIESRVRGPTRPRHNMPSPQPHDTFVKQHALADVKWSASQTALFNIQKPRFFRHR
jgi:hypothetical protein